MKENIIKALIDARTIQAIKNKTASKLTTIAQFMGSPVMGEYNCESMLPDFWEYEMDDPYDAERVADASQNAGELNLGYIYDSLRYGINFEILVRSYGDKVNVIRASLNGNVVFKEEDGVLQAYAPNDNWEKHMEDLYVRAKVLEERENEKIRVVEAEEMKNTKKSFLQKLKMIWGYS